MREARFGLQPLKEWRDGQGVRSSRIFVRPVSASLSYSILRAASLLGTDGEGRSITLICDETLQGRSGPQL